MNRQAQPQAAKAGNSLQQLQQAAQQAYGQVTPEPPKTIVIEASCKNAETKSSDNATWTNKIDPILVKKGSQLRATTTFLDARGVDSDIIQFARTGTEQDNSHTLLSRMYVTNDGLNNKSTSYDYMGRTPIRIINPGSDFPENGNHTLIGGSATTPAVMSTVRESGCIIGVQITNGGKGYSNHDLITWTPAPDSYGTVAYLYALVDSQGTIVDAIFDRGDIDGWPVIGGGHEVGTTLSITSSSGGTGCTMTPTISTYSLQSYSILNTNRGLGYKRGDLLSIAGSDAVFEVCNIQAEGSFFNHPFFDQGYNYQKAPLFRWAQSFDCNDTFTYGRAYGDRVYTPENGKTYEISELSSINQLDPCLSADFNIQNREDEFAPGIFHQGGTLNNFDMFKSMVVLNSDSPFDFSVGRVNNFTSEFGPTEKGFMCAHVDKTEIIDGKTVTIQTNPLSQFPVGTVLYGYFRTKRDPALNPRPADSDAEIAALSNEFINLYGGIYCVGANIVPPKDEFVPGSQADSRVIVLGNPTRFDASGNSDLGSMTYTSFNKGNITNLPLVAPSINKYNTGYPNQTITINTQYFDNQAGEAFGSGCVVDVMTNANGEIEYLAEVVNGGENYNEGDILMPNGPVNPATYPNWQDGESFFYVTRTDGQGGMNMMGHERASKDNFQLSTGTDVEMILIPLPAYQQGIGKTIADINAGSWVFKKTTADGTPGANYTFPGYGSLPPLFGNQLQNSNIYPAGDNDSANLSCGLFRNAGEVSGGPKATPGFVEGNNRNIAHDPTAELILEDSKGINGQNSNGIAEVDLILGIDATTCHLSTPTGKIEDGGYTLSVNRQLMSNALGGYSIEDICLLQGYFVFNVGGANGSVEEHIHLGGGGVTVTATHINIRFAARNIHELSHNGSVPTAAVAAEIGLNHINGYSFSYGGEPVHEAGTYKCQFFVNPLICNNRITLRQATQNSGTIAVGNTQNFYNKNDINLEVLPTINSWKQALVGGALTTAQLTTYDDGGAYYLTHATGNIKAGTTFVETINSKFFGLSQGMGEFLLTENDIANQYPDNLRAVRGVDDPRAYNVKRRCCTIEQIYDYEPVFVNKTFLIDRNFVVPSDIANFWNRTSHEITGFIDRDTGEEILPVEENPLLQNEFLFPCYGSNNEINENGIYIQNNIMYPYQGGYEGGHIVGINGVDADQEWLQGDLAMGLPTTRNTHVSGSAQPDTDISVYFIFFRTAWSLIRNYDPLASTEEPGSDPVRYNPNFEALATLSTKLSNIGNASSTNTATPPHTTTNRTLDGGIMPNKTDHPDYIISELQKPSLADDESRASFPSSAVAYPVRCMKDNPTLKYSRALASQYVGATNMTLAFDPALSSFNFQFFFSPYTSPFVDGQGGDISTRVFYGNRIKGIYNHDTLSGINAENWCRPTYPRNTFSQADVQNNEKYIDYPFGIDPLTAPDPIGLRFMNKLGFSNADIGVNTEGIALLPTANTKNRGTNIARYTASFLIQTDNAAFTNNSINTVQFQFNGTQGAKLGSDDAVLSSIDAPENAAGLHANNKTVTPSTGYTQQRVQKFGDYIYYPYSLNEGGDAFNSAAVVRFDNATQTYGSVGGLRLSNMLRGLGLPNTTGSTVLTDEKSIPRTLNCDCNIYLSYTVQTQSSKKLATNLPRKMEHGHLIILSSLIEDPNFYMSKLGFVNGMSVINKSYITGDFILSNGQLTWYAKEDRYISEITTSIVNTNGDHPTILGDNTTVIYEIIDFKPKPMERPTTIEEIQQQDYEIMEMLNQHLDSTSQGQGSALTDLESALYGLGIATMQEKRPDVVAAMRDKINALQLNKLTPAERAQYFSTPEGQQFMQHAQDIQSLSGRVRQLEQTHQDIIGGYGSSEAVKTFNKQREELAAAIRTTSNRMQQTGVIAPSYTPSLPVEQQIPNIVDRAVRREVDPTSFKYGIQNRHRAYTQYSLERQSQGRHHIPFDQHQNFVYGDVLHPEGGRMPANLPRDIQEDIGDPERYGLSMADERVPRPPPDPVRAAYAASPYLSDHTDMNEGLRQFQGELDSGTADLTYLQEQILNSGGREYRRNPRTGFGVMRTMDKGSPLRANTDRHFPTVVFKDKQSRKEAVKKIVELRASGASQDAIDAHIAEVRGDNYQGIKTGGRPLVIVEEPIAGETEYQEVARGQGAASKGDGSESGVGTASRVSRDPSAASSGYGESVVSSYTTYL
jgi:hypothetical protein